MHKKQELGMVWFIALTALAVRLHPAVASSMPLNDGGLFYAMINDLIANNFVMPLLTSYNGSVLPFAYPPFAFYLGAAIVKITGVPALDLLRFLPAIVSVFSIPSFFGLARRLTSNSIVSVLGTMLFAFTPLVFEWQIMGGGITRSFGQVFAILTLCAVYDLYTDFKPRTILALSLWGALTVLTHPEAALQTVLASLWMWLYLGRSKESFLRSALGAVGVIVLSAPWWLTLLIRFGAAPFLSVFSAAGQDTVPIIARLFLIFQFDFADEPFLTFISVLGILGTFIAFAQKKYFLPVWMLIALIVDMRSGARFTMVPLALLGGIALSEAIIPAILRMPKEETIRLGLEQTLLGNRVMKFFTAYLFIALAFGAFATSSRIADKLTVQPADQDAMLHIENAMPADARIAVITEAHPMLDPVTEWMPALAGRRVLTSAFGVEWLDGEKFNLTIQSHRDLQACTDRDISCLEDWTEKYGDFDYLYISHPGKDFPLRIRLLQEAVYRQVYGTEGVTIFEPVK